MRNEEKESRSVELGCHPGIIPSVPGRPAETTVSENVYQQIFELGNAAAFLISADGFFLEVNAAGCELVGLAKDELLRRPITDFLENEWTWSQNGSATGEWKITRRDGEVFRAVTDVRQLPRGRRLITVREFRDGRARGKALGDSEARLRMATEAVGMFTWEFDPVEDCMWWSDNAAAVIGCRPEQLPKALGGGNSFLSEADQAALFGRFQETVRARQESFEHTFRGLSTGDCEKWFRAQAKVIYDREGNVRRVVGVTQDITEAKRAETSLRAAHDTFHNLVTNSPFGIYVVDADFRLTHMSAGAKKVFENVRPLIGRDFAEILRILWTEPFATEAIQLFRRTLETGEPYHAPATVERRQDNGETESYDWKIERAILPDGRFGVVCHFYDLSERRLHEDALRESEQRFKRMADTTPAVLWITEADGSCSFLSRAWSEWTGQELSEALGFGWLQAVHPEDRQKVRGNFEKANRNRQAFEIDFRLRRTGGELRWVIAAGRPCYSATAEFKGFVGSVIDVHRRKQAEEALRVREKQIRVITDTTPALISYIGADYRYHFANRQYEFWFGRRNGEVIGRTMEEVLGESALKVLRPHIETVLRGETARFEVEVPYRTGGTRWIDAQYVPDKGPDGTVQGFFVLVLDITERKLAEQALKKQNERAALLSQILQDLLGSKDPAGIVRDLFPRLAAQIEVDTFFNFMVDETGSALRLQACGGISESLARKIRHLEFGQAICGRVAQARLPWHATDIQNARDEASSLARQFGIQAYFCNPLIVGNRLLGTLSFASHKRPRFEPDETEFLTTVAHFVAIAMDRLHNEAALREGEEKFRTLADSIPHLAWWANRDGEVIWYNRRWYEYTGTSLEQVRGWEWRRVHDPEWLPRVESEWRASVVSGEPFEMEFPLRRADGQFRWFLTRAIPVHNQRGEVVQWFGTSTDVSDTQEAREVLARSKAELEALVAERTEKLMEMVSELQHLSYAIVHDLRAPLRAMSGFAEALTDCVTAGEDTQEALEYCRRIRIASSRLDKLITDALSYTKFVLLETPMMAVPLAPLLRGILETYPNFHRDKVDILVQGELPVVLGNEALLTQCFANLLGNAVKFVEPGTRPRVIVRSDFNHDSRTSPPGPCREGAESSFSPPPRRTQEQVLPMVRIWVEDNGIGIPAHAQNRLFGMFQKLDNRFEGTGIGLAIVRKVAERMGGRVGVESAPGQGSRFWVDLPRGL